MNVDEVTLRQVIREEFATMVTDADLPTKTDLQEFTTKADLENFATKEDLSGFATKADLTEFATKDDLKAFATKDDLKAFATKEDLTEFAKKDDIAGFATKDYVTIAIDKAIDKLEVSIARSFGDFARYFDERLDQRIKPLEDKFDHMQNTLDGLIDRMDTDEVERAAMSVQLGRHDNWIHLLAERTKTKLPPP